MANIKRLTGYKGSDGSVKNYTFKIIGHDGYLKLCQESVNELNDMLRSGNKSGDERIAINELIDSYQKTIRGEQPVRSFTKEDGAEYIDHCQIITSETIVAAPKRNKNYRNNVTMYKAKLREVLPIRSYIGAFKLAPGKYEFYGDA